MGNDIVAETPSILGREITSFRGGAKLRYADLTGREKRDYLVAAGIRATAYRDGERPDVVHGIAGFAGSAFDSVTHGLLGQTLTREGDELEPPKRKLFHTYGATAAVLFTPEPGTPYTGIFAAPAHGLARFSYAGPVLGVGIVPGLGLKFPVDGDHPSQDAVVMRKLDPQTHGSVFQHVFTNILPLPGPLNFVMRKVNERFETVVRKGKGLHMPVDNLGRIHIDGRPVKEGDVRAPFRVLLSPTPKVRNASAPGIDFRDDLARNILPGTTMYEVLALSEAEAGERRKRGADDVEDLLPAAQKIGTLTSESEFVASRYGDFRLFFKHNDAFLREELRTGA